MKKINFLAPVAMALFITFQASAQDDGITDSHQTNVVVPNVALLDVESTGERDFTATFAQPTASEAGGKLSEVTVGANNLWINYSSVIGGAVTSRSVIVKASALVPGVDVSVVAAAATASGKGTLGTPTAAVTLTLTDQALITGIGSAYTETGVSNGHQLTYSFTAPDVDYGSLVASNTGFIVTYTLADN